METSFIFRRALQVLLPATLLLAACGKDDEPTPPVVADQGRINLYHTAASANVGLKFLFDDAEAASLNYGTNSGYKSINTGSRVLKVNVASSSTTAAAPLTVTVEKDKNYSYFAYANTPTTLAGLFVPDDLTIPAASAGKARIRLVHLGQGSPSTVRLSTVVAGIADIANTEAQFANASGFVDIVPGQYNVAVTAGSPSSVVVNVADGSGTGTGTNKTYEAGKIYTIVLRGINNTLLAADLQPKAVLIQNN